jgi:gluconolactonase
MDAPLDNPKPDFITLIDNYMGKTLNSPNDAVYNNKGDLYFTDPPYGLPMQGNDPAKELEFQGVYKLDEQRKLTLLTKELSRPNGLAFSPDEKKLYVSNSDPEHAVWMVYDVTEKGEIENGKVFYDATEYIKKYSGLPDGLKVHPNGNIFATGPGGLWVFSPQGDSLGMIETPKAISNCAFNDDHSYLYITGADYLSRIRLK